MYALNLSEDGRVLSATFAQYVYGESVLTEELPQGDITDYRYVDGTFLYDPLPVPEELPTHMDRLEAQLIYTAMMTGTLLEV